MYFCPLSVYKCKWHSIQIRHLTRLNISDVSKSNRFVLVKFLDLVQICIRYFW